MKAPTLGEQLKRLRAGRHWTVRELATLAEISPSYVTRLERDERSASREVLDRLAFVYAVSWSTPDVWQLWRDQIAVHGDVTIAWGVAIAPFAFLDGRRRPLVLATGTVIEPFAWVGEEASNDAPANAPVPDDDHA